eukprot:g817.t1
MSDDGLLTATVPRFPLAALRAATDSWDTNNVLGEGGFATVFVGKLSGLGKVAIKKCRIPDSPFEQEFARKSLRAELKTMAHYKHENLVELLGAFVDAQHVEAPYILVYELCENGCLLERLACRNHKQLAVPALSEEQRLMVALGIARALEYLHVKAMPSIIHRDVKSPNILLDGSMTAKLADFGTVRQDELDGNSTHIKTENVIGTRCYMPPEYQSGGQVSVKIDAFALGIVICELLTGINPTEQPLREVIAEALGAGELDTALDSKILWTSSLAAALAKIAMSLTTAIKTQRAMVSAVLPDLERLRNPNYMPTLAVGASYYDPETGQLVTEGGQRKEVDEEADATVTLDTPLLSKQDLQTSNTAGHNRSRLRPILLMIAVATVVVVVVVIIVASHHFHQRSATGCVGTSKSLSITDCTAWRQIQRSKWFTEAVPPACNQFQHSADPCACAGVIGCDTTSGRIVSVDLSDRNLAFRASDDDSLGLLNGLRNLTLTGNSLTGPLPQWVQKFNSLELLSFYNNRLSGPIDIVSQLTALTYLSLGLNPHINGTIGAVAHLTQLTDLHLYETQVSGPINAVAGLTKLTYLNMRSTRLSGPIDAVAKLRLLTYLDLDHNRHVGSIDAVKKLASLTELHLAENLLNTTLASLSKLSSLTVLDLADNRLWGQFDHVSALTHLTSLSVRGHDNHLTGSLHSVSALTKLVHLDVYGNQLPGTLHAVSALLNLKYLNLGSNAVLSGDLAPLSELSGLTLLDLLHCNLTGTIAPVSTLPLLNQLYLSGNRFSGGIDVVKSLTDLTSLDLSVNNLGGPIDAVKGLTKLTNLELGGNDLSGPIDAVKGLTKLTNLELNFNRQLSGPIDAVKGLTKLTGLYLENDDFSGIAAMRIQANFRAYCEQQAQFEGFFVAQEESEEVKVPSCIPRLDFTNLASAADDDVEEVQEEDPLAGWKVSDVIGFLEAIGFEQHIEAIKEHEVTGIKLTGLKQSGFEEMGIPEADVHVIMDELVSMQGMLVSMAGNQDESESTSAGETKDDSEQKEAGADEEEGDSVVEIVHDPTYEPTQKEVADYAEFLGMDSEEQRNPELLALAREGLKAPLPNGWKMCRTKDTREEYYYNFDTEESIWESPVDAVYRARYQEHQQRKAKAKAEGASGARAEGLAPN